MRKVLMAICLLPLMAKATTYYVNGTTGWDGNFGTSESSPKATIQAAIDAAAEGDTILVAPGIYAPIVTHSKRIEIRGVGVRESTVIDGGNVARCAVLADSWRDAESEECRNRHNTRLIGFTLVNGRDSDMANGDGAAVYGGTVCDCVIRECTAVRSIAFASVQRDCLFVKNDASSGYAVLMHASESDGGATNCTIADNKGRIAWDSGMRNTVAVGGSVYISSGNREGYCYNCVLDSECAGGNNVVADPRFVDASKCDYRLAADSPCIDAGNNAYVTTTKDLAGNMRIANGRVDIGCYEYGASGDSLLEGLVAWYKFDGNADDSSGNGNHGVVHGATLTADRFGNRNSAYAFDGDDDYIQVACSMSLRNVRSVMTFSAWVRPNNWSDETSYPDIPIVCKGNDQRRQWGFEIVNRAQGLTFELSDPGHIDVSCSINMDRWQHVVATYDGQCAKAYCNGELVGIKVLSVDYNDAPETDLLIGVDPPSYCKEFLNGSLDDVRIYNRALSAAEVKSLYDGSPNPSPVRHSVTFVLGTYGSWSGGGELSQTVEEGASATAPSVSANAGYRFTGWDCSFDEVTSDLTVTAQYETISYSISYIGVKGGVNPNPTSYTIEDAVTFSALGDVTGYRFTGWSPRSIARGTTGNKTVTAQYAPIAYSISYANTMGAANPNPTSYTIESSVTFSPLADVDGWKFVGWSFAGISRGTTGNLTVSANWEKVSPTIIPDDDEPMDAGVANTYDGVIVDADGLPLGYVTVKAAKASGRGEAMKSKVTVTIQMVGEAKKVTVKGDVNVAEAALVKAAPDGRVLDLLFTHDTISGTFDDYAVEGVRNLLSSTAKGDKGSAAKKKAEEVYNRLKGNYVMAFGDEYGYNGLSVSVGTKGKVKISGKLADGTTVATTSQLIVGEDTSCIPVIYTKKTASLAFNVYFSNDGAESEVFGYYEAVISPVSGLDAGCEFVVEESIYDIFEERDYLLADEFLPYGVSVKQKGTKWIVAEGAKAGKIKVVDGEIVDTAESGNPSGLKLTFTSKTGAFKGSFKVYALDARDKLKTFTATVSGIVVDGYGYGSATIKGVGTVAVTIMN